MRDLKPSGRTYIKTKYGLDLRPIMVFGKRGVLSIMKVLIFLKRYIITQRSIFSAGDKDINIDVSYASIKKIKWVHYVTVA